MSLGRPQRYGSSLFLVSAVPAGLWMGSRHRLVTALHAQVRQLRVERELREQAARTAERTAIAAEMHDVLAHRLSPTAPDVTNRVQAALSARDAGHTR